MWRLILPMDGCIVFMIYLTAWNIANNKAHQKLLHLSHFHLNKKVMLMRMRDTKAIANCMRDTKAIAKCQTAEYSYSSVWD